MPSSRSVAGSYCNVSTSFLPPKPESHTHLDEWVGLLEQGRELRTVSMRVKDEKGHGEEHAYRYHAQDVLRAHPGADALPLLPILGSPDGLHDARAGDRPVRAPRGMTVTPSRMVP